MKEDSEGPCMFRQPSVLSGLGWAFFSVNDTDAEWLWLAVIMTFALP